ncbi:hypothetical protein [Nocardia sp. NPDC050710]|uniref:hypothetical protein n=1 Tax=Nocardia sp. NPDC050710 TaxID=3157220 RepID=UPI0033D6DC66
MSTVGTLRAVAAAIVLGTALTCGTATAAPLALEPMAPVANAPVANDGLNSGSGTGSAKGTLDLLLSIMRGCTPGTVCPR